MKAEVFVRSIGSDFYAGVPDSLLNPLCSYLTEIYGIGEHHVIAANEGNAVGLAAGYHLATGKVPVVYLQNSGLGNIVNPVVSLLNGRIYGIPCLFIVGWRGEPGVHDEPQHLFQGEITLSLLENMDIPAFVIDRTTTDEQVQGKLNEYRELFAQGRQAAFVIRKGGLEYGGKILCNNRFTLLREEAIRHIAACSDGGVVVSTTGKASRELFEIREANGQSHKYDFLTVGSMGHSSSIALGIAFNKPETKVWCIDGDGAVLMHMGAMALIGANRPANLIHIVLNNASHESVGGMPTVAGRLDLPAIAEACGYPNAVSVSTAEELDEALTAAKARCELTFIEVKCALGARENLGRPTAAPVENKQSFMEFLQGGSI
ncbi:MAG: phosphonopyruvate decarboxylase [Oscillospiraceae bacterium]|nr:phosphonopyruvate decarboxylase [Oscillospiraceae bacterium]